MAAEPDRKRRADRISELEALLRQRTIDLEAMTLRFSAIVSMTSDGIVVVDRHGVVRYANPATERLLNRTNEQLIGSPLGTPLLEGDEGQIDVRRGDENFVVELRAAQTIWEEDHEAFVVALRDVTDHQRAIEQLEEISHLKDDFVAMVSHDLRSPLAAIAGFADTLRHSWDKLDEPSRDNALQRISQSAYRLESFIEAILQVSQIESGEFRYSIQAFDLRQVVESTAEEFRQAFPTTPLDVDIGTDLPPALGDPQRQWQILLNLFTNAAKFSPEGAPVRVEVERAGNEIQVAVRDNGSGIDKEDRERIFEKFSRLEGPKAGHAKGAGLGLFICKQMIEAQGGQIHVEGEPGGGSAFVYTMPISQTPESPTPPGD